jgi:DNA helicase II / ATP-dependent DNA helicase PcrA
MSTKSNLNDKQYEAAHTISGPLLILAGAGAGKTKTIVERVVEIVRSGVEPFHILCVTFTNKAAAEMRERVMHRLIEEGMAEEWMGGSQNFLHNLNLPMIKTFHSLGMWIIRRESSLLGLNKNFVILDTDDSKKIIKEYLESVDVDTKLYEPSKIRNAISREKGDFRTVNEYKEKIANYSMEITCNAWEYYEKSLKSQQALDFDDLIIKSVELLRDNQSVRAKYQKLFTHIHIDEYQDTNNAQYELTSLLVNKATNNICVVGDTDQNIYSWRGANLKNIMSFESDYKNAKVILLEENYRSTGNILNLANVSIKKNQIRKDKNLFTSGADGDKVEVLPAWDGESEADIIAINIKELLKNKINPNSIAILYRTNFQSRLLEEKMITYDIPYAVLGVRFFDRKEIKDIMSYMKAALNRDSQADMRRVFDTPKKGVGKATIAKVFANESLSGAALNKVNNVYILLSRIKEMTTISKLSEVMTYALVESGLEHEMKEDGEDGMIRLANISELITLAEKYDGEDFDSSWNAFMEIASLSSDQDNDKKEISGVRLMTVHASKGLEFDYVFISGLETDLFPSRNYSGVKRSKEEEEEERRLFYVAVTRARKRLYLSYAEIRTVFGETNLAAPSIFLDDVDAEIANYNDMHYKSRAERSIYID